MTNKFLLTNFTIVKETRIAIYRDKSKTVLLFILKLALYLKDVCYTDKAKHFFFIKIKLKITLMREMNVFEQAYTEDLFKSVLKSQRKHTSKVLIEKRVSISNE